MANPISNPEGKDWRVGLADDLILRARQERINPSELSFQQRLIHLFYELAKDEKEHPERPQIGYAKAAEKYTDPKALTQIVTIVRKRWELSGSDPMIHIPTPTNGILAKAQQITASKQKYEEPFQTVISVSLDGKYQEDGVRKSLEAFLQSKFPKYAISIPEARKVSANEIDLLVVHQGFATEICESFRPVSWVKSALSKPFLDFGCAIALV